MCVSRQHCCLSECQSDLATLEEGMSSPAAACADLDLVDLVHDLEPKWIRILFTLLSISATVPPALGACSQVSRSVSRLLFQFLKFLEGEDTSPFSRPLTFLGDFKSRDSA